MLVHKTGFWRDFTWRRFYKFSLVFFLSINAFNIIWDYFDPEKFVNENFRFIILTGRFITSLVYGFLIAFWAEPGVDIKKI